MLSARPRSVPESSKALYCRPTLRITWGVAISGSPAASTASLVKRCSRNSIRNPSAGQPGNRPSVCSARRSAWAYCGASKYQLSHTRLSFSCLRYQRISSEKRSGTRSLNSSSSALRAWAINSRATLPGKPGNTPRIRLILSSSVFSLAVYNSSNSHSLRCPAHCLRRWLNIRIRSPLSVTSAPSNVQRSDSLSMLSVDLIRSPFLSCDSMIWNEENCSQVRRPYSAMTSPAPLNTWTTRFSGQSGSDVSTRKRRSPCSCVRAMASGTSPIKSLIAWSILKRLIVSSSSAGTG